MPRDVRIKTRARERGAVLFVSLILLLVLTLIGVTAARMQTVEERIALNDDSHQLAVQSGEAVLRDSEAQFYNGLYANYAFDGTSGTYTLSQEAASGTNSSVADIAVPTAFDAQAVPYSGPPLTAVPVQTPLLTLENMPAVAFVPGGISTASYSASMTSVRTTTLATGADATSYVKVQSIAHQ